MQPVFFLVEDRHIDSYTTGLRFGVGLLRSVTRTRARDGKFDRLDMGKQVVQTLRLVSLLRLLCFCPSSSPSRDSPVFSSGYGHVRRSGQAGLTILCNITRSRNIYARHQTGSTSGGDKEEKKQYKFSCSCWIDAQTSTAGGFGTTKTKQGP